MVINKEIESILRKVEDILGEQYVVEITEEISILFSEREKDLRMKLEVEIGLQKFSQLMKEKQKIKEEAIEGFIKWAIKEGIIYTSEDRVYWLVEDYITSEGKE